MLLHRFVGALLGVLGLSAVAVVPVQAQDPNPDPALVSLGVGYFDIAQQEDEAADFRIELRGGSDLSLWWFRPWIGMQVTSDGAVYGAGGILLDIKLGDHFYMSPAAGVGYYVEGDGRDLGSVLEFRTQFEAGYRFDNRSRLGLAFSHMSNASIGSSNPGTEILSLYYSMPFDWFF